MTELKGGRQGVLGGAFVRSLVPPYVSGERVLLAIAPPPSSFLLLRPSVRLCLRPLLPSPSSSSPSSEASPPSSSYRRRSFSSPPLSFFRFLSSSFLPYSRRNT